MHSVIIIRHWMIKTAQYTKLLIKDDLMAVITKKDEKIAATVDALGNEYTVQQFIDKFTELHPNDWARIEKAYNDHERKTKPGKSHPMPKPAKYLENMLKVWSKANA